MEALNINILSAFLFFVSYTIFNLYLLQLP